MTYIENLIDDVEKTHANFGNLVAVCQIIVKSRKFALIVSPSGCGKSRAMEYLGKNTSGSYMPTSLSMASLQNKVDLLSSFRSVIVIDDIAVIQTPYARNATITTLSALCYNHRVEPSMAGYDFAVEDFYGSALIGIQPVMLRDLMLAPEWEASIQDKALRYYHMYRPLKPNISLPLAQIKNGIDFDSVVDFEPEVENRYWGNLVTLCDCQWSRARVKEHVKDMLKAIASLEGRRNVIVDDYKLLYKLLRPMSIENTVVTKEQLEGERYLDNNLLALLVEYYTYGGEFPLAQIAVDYKLSMSQCYRIMQQQRGYWQQVSKSPTVYVPTKQLAQILKSLDLEIKSDKKNR